MGLFIITTQFYILQTQLELEFIRSTERNLHRGKEKITIQRARNLVPWDLPNRDFLLLNLFMGHCPDFRGKVWHRFFPRKCPLTLRNDARKPRNVTISLEIGLMIDLFLLHRAESLVQGTQEREKLYLLPLQIYRRDD